MAVGMNLEGSVPRSSRLASPNPGNCEAWLAPVPEQL